MVIAPASTGNDSINNHAVIKILQIYKGNNLICLIFIIVLIILIAPNKLDIPAKCKLNIAKSTVPPI